MAAGTPAEWEWFIRSITHKILIIMRQSTAMYLWWCTCARSTRGNVAPAKWCVCVHLSNWSIWYFQEIRYRGESAALSDELLHSAMPRLIPAVCMLVGITWTTSDGLHRMDHIVWTAWTASYKPHRINRMLPYAAEKRWMCVPKLGWSG